MENWGAQSPCQTVEFQYPGTRRAASSLARSAPTPPGVSTSAVAPSFRRKSKVQILPPGRRPRARLRRSRRRGREGWRSTGSTESFRVRWGERRAGAKFYPLRGARPKFFGGSKKTSFAVMRCSPNSAAGGVFPLGILVSPRDGPVCGSSLPSTR